MIVLAKRGGFLITIILCAGIQATRVDVCLLAVEVKENTVVNSLNGAE
jgi:hypothetical protein